jgi:hypothetical protein
VIIKGGTLFKNNQALGESAQGYGGDGGGGTLHDRSQAVISDHTIFEGNNATGSGECYGPALVAATALPCPANVTHSFIFCLCRWSNGHF